MQNDPGLGGCDIDLDDAAATRPGGHRGDGQGGERGDRTMISDPDPG